MSGQLSDKVAVVTGATTGIGFAIARRFAAESAQVFITGRRKEALDEAVNALGNGVTGLRCDVSKLADLDALYEAVGSDAGRIDILVANAGVGSLAPLGQVTEEQFDETFATNVKGAFFTVQKALPLLRPGSSVILTGSTAGTRPGPAFSVYGATKAAVRNLARGWTEDLRGTGIRVNVLSPGPTKTPGLLDLVPSDQQGAFLGQLEANVPLGRVADPDEIGKAAVFLASDASSFVAGTELFADGGHAQI